MEPAVAAVRTGKAASQTTPSVAKKAQGAPAPKPMSKAPVEINKAPESAPIPALSKFDKPTALSSSQAAVPPPPPSGASEGASLGRDLPKPKRSAKEPPKPKNPAKNLDIPPILLEGDFPPALKGAGPGSRYALAPQPFEARVAVEKTRGDLPEGYGTQRLFLTARDPRWLYASWDLTAEQQRACNFRSRHGHLILRVFANESSEPVVPEIHVNPESRTWFINVPFSETRYHAELGLYRSAGGGWETISTSLSTFTPPEAPSIVAAPVEFATIPATVTFQEVVEVVKEFISENRPLLEAVAMAQDAERQEQEPQPPVVVPHQPDIWDQIKAEEQVPLDLGQQPVAPEPPVSTPVAAFKSTPETPSTWRQAHLANHPPAKRKADTRLDDVSARKAGRGEREAAKPPLPIKVEQCEPWTSKQTAALVSLIRIDSYRRVWMGSIEITELVRRHLEEEVGSMAAAERTRGAEEKGLELAESSPGAPAPAPGKGRGFWFKVNAELIIYGSTEPDARVTVAGRTVKLRPDGTFSFRFALPDGRYGLPAMAVSADEVEFREARLEFSRSTEYHGEVPPHPQDPNLRAPRPENI